MGPYRQIMAVLDHPVHADVVALARACPASPVRSDGPAPKFLAISGIVSSHCGRAMEPDMLKVTINLMVTFSPDALAGGYRGTTGRRTRTRHHAS